MLLIAKVKGTHNVETIKRIRENLKQQINEGLVVIDDMVEILETESDYSFAEENPWKDK
ncbi:hypothetical protein GCM10011409_37910 [Lentibacillus populi]|uniref:Uncharacterized protein n=1 Tax=Lentibacillus populi TaxID=1827502 RepID=A0A9W5X7J8_9BACI|nr:hypothetical protein [Lentibacillus populi]GGB56763.1 hypothetical protein GCM10011409_37910 [Lentibacillus populi]